MLLAHQESMGLELAFGSFPANQDIYPGCLLYLRSIERLIVCHDMDPVGRKSVKALKDKYGDFVKIASLPNGNDLTDFYLGGGNLFEWLYQALEATHDEQ